VKIVTSMKSANCTVRHPTYGCDGSQTPLRFET
jgi:hypothetical protein